MHIIATKPAVKPVKILWFFNYKIMSGFKNFTNNFYKGGTAQNFYLGFNLILVWLKQYLQLMMSLILKKV